MKERPIIFSTEMVKAILDGRKTQTRRVLKTKDHPTKHEWHAPYCCNMAKCEWCFTAGFGMATKCQIVKCPYGQPGDRLWVRETWQEGYRMMVLNPRPYFAKGVPEIIYKADDPICVETIPWKPSIHMPKKYARIWLEITNIRVERLQDITEKDANKEGLQNWYPDPKKPNGAPYTTNKRRFQDLWDSINAKKHPWSSNPWVWVVEFLPVPAQGEEN